MIGAGMKSLGLFAPVVSSFLVYLVITRLQVKEEKALVLVGGDERVDS